MKRRKGVNMQEEQFINDDTGVKTTDPNFNVYEHESWDNPEWGEAYYHLVEAARDAPEQALVDIKKEVEMNRTKIILDPDREEALRRSLNYIVYCDRGADYEFHRDWMKAVINYNENIPDHLTGKDWLFDDSKKMVRRLFGYDGDGDWGDFNGVLIEDFTLATLREIYKEGQEEDNMLLLPENNLFISGMQRIVELGKATSSDKLEMLIWARELVADKDRTRDIYGTSPGEYEDLRIVIQQSLDE